MNNLSSQIADLESQMQNAGLEVPWDNGDLRSVICELRKGLTE